jgi:hypothetical protein
MEHSSLIARLLINALNGNYRVVSDKPTYQGADANSAVKSASFTMTAEMIRVRADFNGLFGELLCLSHQDTCVDNNGKLLKLHQGMVLTAFDEDSDEHGNRDDLIACGAVVPSPEWLRCNGSRWALRIDQNGVRHESDLSSGTGPLATR